MKSNIAATITGKLGMTLGLPAIALGTTLAFSAPASAAQFTPSQCSAAKAALASAKSPADLTKVYAAVGIGADKAPVIKAGEVAAVKQAMAAELKEGGCK